VKPQRVHCKLGETTEQPCSDVLAHNAEVCKGAHLYNRYQASKDDHDSWEMCTTSAESQTVITAMLTVMRGMDPHMISGTWMGFLLSLWLGCVEVCLLGCWSVTVRLHNAIEVVTIEEMSSLLVY
jgi:hypothetical protein